MIGAIPHGPPLEQVTVVPSVPTIASGDFVRCQFGVIDNVFQGWALGDKSATQTTMLVTEFPSGQWIPALSQVALDNDYRLVTPINQLCYFARVPLVPTTAHDTEDRSCFAWNAVVWSTAISGRCPPYSLRAPSTGPGRW